MFLDVATTSGVPLPASIPLWIAGPVAGALVAAITYQARRIDKLTERSERRLDELLETITKWKQANAKDVEE